MKRSAYILAIALGSISGIGCSRPLPEEGTRAAELYRARCAADCHRPYAPSSMKYPMWEMIFPAMEEKIVQSGRPKLNTEERRILLEYLKRHSG